MLGSSDKVPGGGLKRKAVVQNTDEKMFSDECIRKVYISAMVCISVCFSQYYVRMHLSVGIFLFSF